MQSLQKGLLQTIPVWPSQAAAVPLRSQIAGAAGTAVGAKQQQVQQRHASAGALLQSRLNTLQSALETLSVPVDEEPPQEAHEDISQEHQPLAATVGRAFYGVGVSQTVSQLRMFNTAVSAADRHLWPRLVRLEHPPLDPSVAQ